MKIGFKFCGQCQPKVDIMELFSKLKENSTHEFIFYAHGGYDLLLVLQACTAPCVNIEDTGPRISVFGYTLGGCAYSGVDELCSALTAEISNYDNIN